MLYKTVEIEHRYYDIHFHYTGGNFDYHDDYRIEGVYELADRACTHNYLEELDYQFICDVKSALEVLRNKEPFNN